MRINMHSGSMSFIAFITLNGLFFFNRMPCGPESTSRAFQIC